MGDIDKLMAMLQSVKASRRYDACEELRVTDSLPPAAIAALEKATDDPDASVRDAAARALAVHKPPPKPTREAPSTASPAAMDSLRWVDVRRPVVLGTLAGLAATIITAYALTHGLWHPRLSSQCSPVDLTLREIYSRFPGCLPVLVVGPVAGAIAGLSRKTAAAVVVGMIMGPVSSWLLVLPWLVFGCVG